MKFKVGDRVRIVNDEGEIQGYKENIGCTGVIKNVYDGFDKKYALISNKNLANKGLCKPYLKNLELVEDTTKYKQGDILINADGDKRKVLGVSGLVYHMSSWKYFYKSDANFTQEQLDEYGYKLYQEEDDQFEEAKKLLQDNGYKIVKE